MKHWINGGETVPANMTLQCEYHHKLLHEGAFGIVKEDDGTLRFVTADGRTIPSNGYQTRHVTDSAPAQCRATSNDPAYGKRAPSIA